MQQQCLEPILQFTQEQREVQNIRDNPFNYSFGREVYQDFTRRSKRILETLCLEDSMHFHMVGDIKRIQDKKKYVLQTALGFISEISPALLAAINFLNDMTQAPQKIFNDEKYQANFKAAVFLLKNNKIGLQDSYKLKDEFLKEYEFNEYLFYNSHKSCLTHASWSETGTNMNEGTIAPMEEEIPIHSLPLTLKKLDKEGLIEFDYSCITKLRETSTSFSAGQGNTLAYYKRLVETEQKINNPLFSISKETSVSELIDILGEEKTLEYFPFSSSLGSDFIASALRDCFKKQH